MAILGVHNTNCCPFFVTPGLLRLLLVIIVATSRSLRLAPVSHHVGVKVTSHDNIGDGSDSPDGVGGGTGLKIIYCVRQLIKMMDSFIEDIYNEGA